MCVYYQYLQYHDSHGFERYHLIHRGPNKMVVLWHLEYIWLNTIFVFHFKFLFVQLAIKNHWFGCRPDAEWWQAEAMTIHAMPRSRQNIIGYWCYASQGCNNMPVMLIRVIRDCNVRSDFYDVNRVLFKDGRVLSRFLIMVAAVQWYFSPHTNPWTPKVGWMQDKLFIYLFDLRLVRDAEVFAPKPSRFHQSRCMGRLETAFRAVQDSH